MDCKIEDGLHFGLPEELYHAIPAISASGIKQLLAHPMMFWANSWMNPHREQNDTEARTVGKAYHKRILEGKEAFYSAYAPKFSAPADCLTTQDDLKKLCAESNLAVSGTKAVLVDRLRGAGVAFDYYDDLLEAYQDEHDGKEFLSEDLIARIELSAAMIEKHPALSRCFVGGMPEVTVVWTGKDGFRYKCRFDYLKPKAIIDLKTFENMGGKSVDRAIYLAMASYKYHVQGVFYGEVAAPMAVKFAKEGRVFGYAPPEFLKSLSEAEEHGFYFVFQQKGTAPIAKGKKLPRGAVWNAGSAAIEEAIRIYKQNFETFGTDPWVDTGDIDQFEDMMFPAYATEF